MKLYIGNRNYSSWSMRPGVPLAQAGIEHEAVVIRLVVDDGQAIWDTLAYRLGSA